IILTISTALKSSKTGKFYSVTQPQRPPCEVRASRIVPVRHAGVVLRGSDSFGPLIDRVSDPQRSNSMRRSKKVERKNGYCRSPSFACVGYRSVIRHIG